MSEPAFELFPGFEIPPNDPSRDVKRAAIEISRPPEDDMGNFDDQWEEQWCDECQNHGTIICHCGGDICICHNNGEYPCPYC